MLLEEIEYYDVNSYKKYIKDNIIPLFELSNVVKRYFNEIDVELAKYAEDIHTLCGKVIKLAETKLGLKYEKEQLPEPKDVYEVIEYGRRFLERAFNFTSASNPFTFFIWSIRKITKAYLKIHYPKLFEDNTFEKISSILGLEKYWSPPEIKPREVVEDYTLYAYPDFKTGYQDARDTIGGLISKLNEKILFKPPGIKSYGVLYKIPEISISYRDKIDKMLEDIGWKQNSEIATTLAKARKSERVFYFSINGLIVELSYPYLRMPIFNFLDEIMPPQMLGMVEIKIKYGVNKWEGEIEIRWWW